MTLLLVVTGCSKSDGGPASQGPTKAFCGTVVGRAQDLIGSGPFFLDGSDTDVGFRAKAHASGTWVRVTGDCAHGTAVTLPASPSVQITSVLPAADGADLAVLLGPEEPGTAVVRLTHPDHSRTTITVDVEP